MGVKYAFVLIKTKVGQGPKVAKNLHKLSEVREFYLVTGPFDFLVIVETEKLDEIGTLLAEKIATIPGVKRTQTMMAFRPYKYVQK